jgi:hypothetical protein
MKEPPRKPGLPTRGLPSPHGVEHQFRRVVYVKFLQEMGAVRLDGRGTDREQFRDLFAAVAFGHQLEDFPLAKDFARN